MSSFATCFFLAWVLQKSSNKPIDLPKYVSKAAKASCRLFNTLIAHFDLRLKKEKTLTSIEKIYTETDQESDLTHSV